MESTKDKEQPKHKTPLEKLLKKRIQIVTTDGNVYVGKDFNEVNLIIRQDYYKVQIKH